MEVGVPLVKKRAHGVEALWETAKQETNGWALKSEDYLLSSRTDRSCKKTEGGWVQQTEMER